MATKWTWRLPQQWGDVTLGPGVCLAVREHVFGTDDPAVAGRVARKIEAGELRAVPLSEPSVLDETVRIAAPAKADLPPAAPMKVEGGTLPPAAEKPAEPEAKKPKGKKG